MDNFDVYEWNKKRYLNESREYLKDLAQKLTKENPLLNFIVNNSRDEIRVVGTDQDKFNWAEDNRETTFGEYEVFHTQDDDMGEMVHIIKK